MTLATPARERKPRGALKRWMQANQAEIFAFGLVLIWAGMFTACVALDARSPDNAWPQVLVITGGMALSALFLWWVISLTPKPKKEAPDVPAQP